MPGSDLMSIPLPSDSEQQQQPSQKMSAKEILDKASKGHKPPMKLTGKDNGDISDPSVKNENSQSIVDELFKDFISQKMTKTLKYSSGHEETGTSDRGLTSISEMSRLLDMEISSIQAHSKDVTDSAENGDDKKCKSVSVKRKSQSENVSVSPSQSVRNTTREITTSYSPPLKQPCLSSNLISFPMNKSSPPETHNINPTSQVDSHVSAKVDTIASDQATAEQATDQPISHPKKMISNNHSLTKKTSGPIQLGCKLSIQSLNLIQSTDKIDRKGRVWEEGEVPSSQSEPSDKEDDASESDHDDDHKMSDTGSIGSNDGDSKHRSSKHKKKHKHKHKKKKKKSTKEKDKVRHRSSENNRNKESSRQKVKGKDDDDKREDDTGLSQSRSRKHSDNGSEKISTDGMPVDEKERGVVRQDAKSLSKEKEKDESKRCEKDKKRKQDRSRSPKHHRRSKSRSRSRSRSPKKCRKDSSPKRSSTRSQFNEYDARYYSDNPSKTVKSHSHSPEPEGKSSRSKRSRSGDHDRDLRLKIDKAKLRKIAIANALNNLKSGKGPQLDMVTAKAGGKSVEELTDFCKRISEKDRDNDVSDSSDEEPESKSDDDELPIHHPFKVKETSSNIIMNIRNAKQLPILTPSEKQAQQASLRLAFPVSSGSHHRASESEWVPVEKTKTVSSTTVSKAVTSQATIDTPKTEESKGVFPEPKDTQDIDIGSIISERLQAVRKLQENPYDVQALTSIHKAQEKATQWATSKHLPGQFLGSTGAKILSQEELIGDKHHQAWAKKSQFTKAAPISGGIGLFLLQKMGWKQGQGLGKNSEGSKEPLQLDFKIDRKGLSTALDNPKPQILNVPRTKDLSSKHPVSALMELCNRRRWGAPIFSIVIEDGPDHKKNFLFKVKVNNVEYQPTVPDSNKKSAKAQCAAVCLQEMGLLPRNAPMNY